ncbi:MAG: hypothetical protein AB7N65_27075 [Vicinamibacterales bacterium]
MGVRRGLLRAAGAMFVLAVTSSPSLAQLIDVNLDNPPSSAGNRGVYSGAIGSIVVDVRNGSPTRMFEHVTGGECWGARGGCARFFGSVSGGGAYRGFTLGNFSGGTTRKNLRYLMKWNSAWRGAENLKGNHMSMGNVFWTQEKAMNSALGGFQLAISYNSTLYFVHGNGQSQSTCNGGGYSCCPYSLSCSLGPGVSGAGPFMFSRYDNQWVVIELEMLSSGVFREYIWTQDGRFNGLYMEARNVPPGTPQITGFSGMYYHDSGAANGSYVMVDEVVLSDRFIGPPAGFANGVVTPPPAPSQPPATPTALRILR